MKMSLLLSSILSLSFPLIADEAADVASLKNSHTQFAFSLYPTMEASDANLVFSPYSIATCLSMVYLGARGDTESQIESTLHLNIDRKIIAKTALSLSQSLALKKNEEHGYQLNTANSLWVEQGTFLLSDFRYAIVEQFKAKLGLLNFGQSANAVKTINNWVATQTQDKIKDLLSDDDVNANTKLVLANAVYFKGEWVQPFNGKATQDWPFHPTPETTTTAKMMQQTFSPPYFENDLIQATALPFKGSANSGGQLAFFILLPKSADNFSKMIQELPLAFQDWVSSLKPQRISLKLPKFRLTSRFDLVDPLKHLGMEDAFDTDANFAGIDGLRDLFISKVIHQALFDLDENGIVATAATAAAINVTAGFPNEPPVAMNVDHPFLFFIIDLKSQGILFMGKVGQPGPQP